MADQVTERALKIASDRFKWNQRQFAEEIGVDKQHVTNWLARGMPPSRHAKVAATLRITIEELLTGASGGEDARLFAELQRAWQELGGIADRQELVEYAQFKAKKTAETRVPGSDGKQQQARPEGSKSEGRRASLHGNRRS